MTTAPATDERPTRLRRAVTGPLLFLFILGDVLGAGVYALVGEMSAESGGMLWLPLLVALLMALLTAASYAELVTKYPQAGGSAVYAQRAYGRPLLSFLVGFSMLAAGVTSAAGLSLAFAGDYLGTFLDVPAVPTAIVFLALVAAAPRPPSRSRRAPARPTRETAGAHPSAARSPAGRVDVTHRQGVLLAGCGTPR